MMTQLAATAPGVMALHKSGNALLPFSLSLFFFLSWGLNRFHTLHAAGFVRVLIAELWSVLECSIEDARVVRPKVTPMEPIDRNCLKVPCLACNVNNSLFEAIFFLITGFSRVKKPTDEVWTVSCHWRLYILYMPYWWVSWQVTSIKFLNVWHNSPTHEEDICIRR